MKKLRVGVLISGNGSNLQAIIDACADKNFPAEVVSVISNKETAYGLERAAKAGIKTSAIRHKDYPDRNAFDEALHAQLIEDGVEFVCLAGFMRLLTAEFVGKWENKMINIHPSLLPAFKGLDVQQAAIDAGVKFSGCTVHFVTPEMDAGPIIVQAVVPVHQDDTADSLAERIHKVEHQCYPLAVKLAGEGRLSVKSGRVFVEGEQDVVAGQGFLLNSK